MPKTYNIIVDQGPRSGAELIQTLQAVAEQTDDADLPTDDAVAAMSLLQTMRGPGQLDPGAYLIEVETAGGLREAMIVKAPVDAEGNADQSLFDLMSKFGVEFAKWPTGEDDPPPMQGLDADQASALRVAEAKRREESA